VSAPAATVRRSRGPRDLRLVIRQTRFEQLNFWLNPVGATFTVVFSVIFLVIAGVSSGSQRVSYLGNVKLIDYYEPAFVAYGIMAACFTMLAISLVNRREAGLLKRLRLSPLPAWALLASIVLSTLVVAAIQVVLVLAVGRLAFQVPLPAHPLSLVVTLAIGVLCFTALGMAMSTVVPNADSAGPLIATVFFVLLFLSGLWFPLKAGSVLARISDWFPVRHLIVAVFTTFSPQGGSAWPWHNIGVVAIWGVGGFAVALLRFRWAPMRSGH
jgi:ABC-2 type transport system permease protein